MLQHLSKQSTKLLLDLYIRVWTEGTFPSARRHSIIIPVLKSGKDPQDFSSNRPISLTSTVDKVMEKLVTNRLTYHLEKNKLLTNVQTGFRKGKSTTDHIKNILELGCHWSVYFSVLRLVLLLVLCSTVVES